MQHRKIANILKLAGGIATFGIIFVFYILPFCLFTSFRMLDLKSILALIFPPALVGLPYLAALRDYFIICSNIGNERSFCAENAALLRRIAHLFILDSILWCAVLPWYVRFGSAALIQALPFWHCAIVLLFFMADWALALLACMISRLLERAEELQNENDLTI